MRLNTATIRREKDRGGVLEVRATFGDTGEYDYGPKVSEFTLRMGNGRLSFESAEAIKRLLDALCEYPTPMQSMQSMLPIAQPAPTEEPATEPESELELDGQEEETIDG